MCLVISVLTSMHPPARRVSALTAKETQMPHEAGMHGDWEGDEGARFTFGSLVLQPSWPLTGVIRALRARNPKEVEKSSWGLSTPGSKKVEKKSKKGQKQVKNNLFSTFSTLFRLFFNIF